MIVSQLLWPLLFKKKIKVKQEMYLQNPELAVQIATGFTQDCMEERRKAL